MALHILAFTASAPCICLAVGSHLVHECPPPGVDTILKKHSLLCDFLKTKQVLGKSNNV